MENLCEHHSLTQIYNVTDIDMHNEVETHLRSWVKYRTGTQTVTISQLEWEANIVEYVNFLYKSTKHHGNSKKNAPPPNLLKEIPLLGPHFIPPSYLHIQKRQPTPTIQPQTTYLKPLNIVHPFYYAGLGKCCPQCDSSDVQWDGWTTSHHRDVHGIQEEETVLGFQLLC